MKKIKLLQLWFILFISITSLAQNLQPTERSSILDHLKEINKEWAIQDFESDFLNQETSFLEDDDRIQLHLKLVEKILRKRVVTNLTSQQKANRIYYLDILKTYWQTGVFPKNSFHPHRQPYFVDEFGTACAVGYLVKESGANDFVEKIRKENNYGYISELQMIYPELKDWADENGFTLKELAWIQPAYPEIIPQEYHEVGNGGGTNGRINVMKTSTNGDHLYIAGDFTEIDGVAANSIVRWDGENWSLLGEGIDGEIFTMTDPSYISETFYVGGNFTINGSPEYSNIAYWNGTDWEGIQMGDMEGTVYTLLKHFNALYAGGDFKKIDDKPIEYLAKYSGSSVKKWNNSSDGNVSNAFAVNGPVTSLETVNFNILVGGDFDMTAPEVMDTSINQFNTNLAYWDGDNWISSFDLVIEDIQTVKTGIDGSLYVGGIHYDYLGYGQLNFGLWRYIVFFDLDNSSLTEEPKIHGFVSYKNTEFVYGNIDAPDFSPFSDASGFIQVRDNDDIFFPQYYLSGQFDKTVRAAEVFQDNIYFAGDFTMASETPMNGLTYSSFNDLPTSVYEGAFREKSIQVFNYENQLQVRYENLNNNSTIHLFNLQGQMIQTIDLPQGTQQLEFNLSNWAGGMYVYQVVSKDGKQAGKFHVN